MDFIKKLFSESGEASWSRIGSAIALFFSLVWITGLVYAIIIFVLRSHIQIADTTQLIEFFKNCFSGLGAICDFIKACVWLVGSIYGLGKLNESAQRLWSKPPEDAK